MKHVRKKHNGQRLAVAIREAYIIMCHRCGWWGCYHFHDDLASLIFEIGLKADKYDVLCLVLAGHCQKRPVFIRGDIRYKRSFFQIELFLLILLLFLLVFTN